ncbi:AAA family ATPase [Neobittarella massiliensis]|uniref:nucleotide-binding protein n=1 Tax=Neobittarella massiliensis (ex Bilen et al. 2018) TaxID=2041842 RepID=UPI000CF6EB5A|nr:AAA family ATPase [Neobittarella massiliensis]
MGDIALITSGKGGVGKTTVGFFTGVALAALGRKVLAIELDTGLRGLDIMAGISQQTVFHLGDVTEGRISADRAVVPCSFCPNLHILPAPFTPGSPIVPQKLFELCRAASRFYDYTLLDAPAGVGEGFRVGAYAADRAIIVTTPDIIAARDAGVVGQLLDDFPNIASRRLVINRVEPRDIAKSSVRDLDEVIDLAGAQLLGVVPMDHTVHLSATTGASLPAKGLPARVFANIAARLEGAYIPLDVQ